MWNSTEKRSRSRHDDDQMAPEAKARRFEALERLSGELVDRVATVNADVIGSLLAKWEHTAHEGLAARARATELESRVVKAKEEQARAEVTTAAVTQQLHRHAVLLDSMEAKLQQSASKAAETVVRQLDALMTPSLRRTAAQLEKERDINDALAERVQQFLAQCMRTLQVSSQRALEAELQTAESAVTIARLKASLTFEQTRSFRHTEEIETLLVILRALAERTRGAEQAKQDLQRSKEHVRRLERHLDLNGIVAAITTDELAGEDRQGDVGGSSSSSLVVRPPAPAKELKLSAPHYFALRMLQHKDMTLSELVDAWERQEDRIKTAESRYVELQEAVKTLKEDAALVHQRYLEEKQRREITDRRMTEMVLERVERDRTQATQTEIARLRSHYAQVVDDASQLAVTLQMTTAALADAQTRASALETQVKQLETDAATDEIASTICALRRQYDSKLASLRAEFVDAQTERQLALTMAESRGRDQQRVQEALLLSRENNTEMSTTLLETLKRGPYTRSSQEEVYARQECEESRAALLDMTNRVHSAVEYLEDVQREVVNDRQDALQAFGSQLAELTASFEALCTRPSAPKAPSTTVDTTVGRAGRDADGEKRPALAADAETPSQQLQQLQLQESNKVMKRVVQDSLEFVAGQLESTEQQRNHMVDASLSDAQYVAFMVDKLRRVTADRDALRAELKRSYGIIEQNHLAVVEHALMHDVSVEDSINAAEAAEQIESLRQELAALQQGRDAALAEVKHARADSGDVATRLAVADREKTLLETQVKRLTDALHSSFRREAALHKRTIDLHGRLEALAESHRALEESCSPGAGAEDGASQQASLARLEQMAERVEEQLGTCQRLLTERKEEEQQEAIALAAQTVEDLEADLARCGLHKVATLLYEALAGSRMLQNTVDMSVLQRRSELAAAAITEADVTPEMKIANLTLRNHQLSEDLAALKQHRVQYEERLQSVTEAMGKSEMHTKRLLEVSNRLLEEKNRLGQKVVALQAEVDQLRLPPPPATPAASATTDPSVDAATTGAPPPLTVEPGTETEGPAATDGETHSEAPLAESAGSAEHEETPADIAEPPHPTADEPSS